MKYLVNKCNYNETFFSIFFDDLSSVFFFFFNLGAYVLYVYWSEQLVPKCPYKITASNKGASGKVKVTGQGLKGGYVGQELHLDVDTTEASFGTFCSYRIHVYFLC